MEGKWCHIMKIKSIQKYIFENQLLQSLFILLLVYMFSLIILLFSINHSASKHAAENTRFIQNYVHLFFSEYNDITAEYNKNQTIRNGLTYINNNASLPTEMMERISKEMKDKDNVYLYSLENQVYPLQNKTNTLMPLDTKAPQIEINRQEEKLYYTTLFYNFTQNKVIGYIQYVIPLEQFQQAMASTLLSEMEFSIKDYKENIIWNNIPESSRVARSVVNTLWSEDNGFLCTSYIELRQEYGYIIAFSIYMIPTLGLIFLFSLAYSKKLAAKLASPINALIASIQANQIGDLSYTDVFESDLMEINTLGNAYKDLIDKINMLIDKNQKINLLQIETKLSSLQQHINPHFLFNTLELISSQAILEDADKTAILTQKLGSLFRHSLRAPDIISLQEELAYATDYLYLQKVRYNNQLTYSCQTEEDVLWLNIPKLTLQPILENCFKYGFKDLGHKDHEINIHIWKDQHNIYISIQNNGHAISKDRAKEINESLLLDYNNFAYFIQRQEHIGLRNVNARLCMYYHVDNALTINSNQNTTEVILTLPIKTNTKGGHS